MALKMTIPAKIAPTPAVPKPMPAYLMAAVCNSVAAELPKDWALNICLERGSGWVELFKPDGARVMFPDADMSLPEQVLGALETAKEWK